MLLLLLRNIIGAIAPPANPVVAGRLQSSLPSFSTELTYSFSSEI